MSVPWGQAVLAGHLGATFAVRTATGERCLELVEVAALPARETGDDAIRSDPFTLLFRADGDALPQGTYRFEHSELDAIDVFLTPVGPGKYEAIFN